MGLVKNTKTEVGRGDGMKKNTGRERVRLHMQVQLLSGSLKEKMLKHQEAAD